MFPIMVFIRKKFIGNRLKTKPYSSIEKNSRFLTLLHAFKMKKFFGKKSQKGKDDNSNTPDTEESKLPPLNVLVMDGDRTHNWPAIFHGKNTSNNRPIHIYQASWNKVEVTTYPEYPIVHMQPLHTTKSYLATLEQEKAKKDKGGSIAYESKQSSYEQPTCDVKPHFLLIRNQPRGALPVTDCLNAFYGLMMANVPCMNSFQAVYMNLERPIMLGALRAIEKRVGHDKFPLINATYYSSERQMVIAPEMPAVIKIAHAHAGINFHYVLCFMFYIFYV